MERLEFITEAESVWRDIHPDQDLTALSVMQRLIWSGRLAADILERTAIDAGLRKRGDYEVLVLIRRSDPITLNPADVADALLVSTSGLTAKLDRLENQGLIERIPDASDRRALRLRITPAGRRLADRAFLKTLDVYREMLAEQSPADLAALSARLELVLRAID